MPPEAPNEMEQLLRRYAKQRREQAGDFTLDPATRRVLQGEVARTFTAAPDRSQGLWAWLAAWRGFAIGFSLLVLLGAGLALLMQRDNPSAGNGPGDLAKLEKAERDASKRKESAPAIAAEPYSISPELSRAQTTDLAMTPPPPPNRVSGPEAAQVQPGKPATRTRSFRGAAEPSDAATSASTAVSAQTQLADRTSAMRQDAPAAATAPAVLGEKLDADSTLEMRSNSGQTTPFYSMTGAAAGRSPKDQEQLAAKALEDRAKRELQEPSGATQPLSQSAALSAGVSLDQNGAQTQRDLAAAAPAQPTFQRMAPTAGSRVGKLDSYRQTETAESKSFSLLGQFNVQQSGTVVRLTDADGSVYEGTALADPTVAGQVGAAGAKPTMLRFRVSGTNRTLQQPVLVSGRMPSLASGNVGTLFAQQEATTNGEPKEIERGVAAQIVPAAPAIPATTPIGRARQSGGTGGAAMPSTNVAVIEGTLQIGQAPERPFKAVKNSALGSLNPASPTGESQRNARRHP